MFCKQDIAKPGNVFCLSVECSAACTGRVTIQSSLKLCSSHVHTSRNRESGRGGSLFGYNAYKFDLHQKFLPWAANAQDYQAACWCVSLFPLFSFGLFFLVKI